MPRGKKLDLFIGAEIEEGWNEVAERKTTINKELVEPSKHFLFFKKEKRRGKVVTLVGEFFLEQNDADNVLKSLKKKLACGGTYKEGWMEFQGELQEKLKLNLQDLGFRFKR